jgi:hypothetical protein
MLWDLRDHHESSRLIGAALIGASPRDRGDLDRPLEELDRFRVWLQLLEANLDASVASTAQEREVRRERMKVCAPTRRDVTLFELQLLTQQLGDRLSAKVREERRVLFPTRV